MCEYLKKLRLNSHFQRGQCIFLQGSSHELNMTDLKLVELLLRNGVAVAPGSGFGSNYSNYIRLSTCLEEKKMIEGIKIISDLLNKH